MQGVLFANALSMAIFYGFWRMHKEERATGRLPSLTSVAWVAIPAIFIVVAIWPV